MVGKKCVYVVTRQVSKQILADKSPGYCRVSGKIESQGTGSAYPIDVLSRGGYWWPNYNSGLKFPGLVDSGLSAEPRAPAHRRGDPFYLWTWNGQSDRRLHV